MATGTIPRRSWIGG